MHINTTMRLSTLFIMLLSLSSGFLFSQNFSRHYLRPLPTSGVRVTQMPDNGYLFVGIDDPTGTYRIRIIRTNSHGDTLYTRLVPGSKWSCFGVYAHSDNSFTITGGTTQATRDFMAQHYSPNGRLIWTKTVQLNTGSNYGTCIARQPKHRNYIIPCVTYNTSSIVTGSIVRIDTAGNNFQANNTLLGQTVVLDIKPSTNGENYIIAGDSLGRLKILVIDSGLNVVMNVRYALATGNISSPRIVEHSSGNYYAFMDSAGIPYMIKINNTGQLLQKKKIPLLASLNNTYSVLEDYKGDFMFFSQLSQSGIMWGLITCVNQQGDTLWSNRFLGSQDWHTLIRDVVKTTDGGYAITGHYLSPTTIFLLKTDSICSLASGSIRGLLYHDANNNQIPDVGEQRFSQRSVWIEETGEIAITANDGSYNLNVHDTGTYTIRTDTLPYWHLTSPFGSSVTKLISSLNKIDTVNFSFQKNTVVRDIQINSAKGFLRVLRPYVVMLSVYNNGNTTQDSVRLKLDISTLNLLSASEPYTAQNSLYEFYLDSIPAVTNKVIRLVFQLPLGTAAVNDTVCFQAYVFGKYADSVYADNYDTICQIVTAAHDPNTKTVMPAGDENHFIPENTSELTWQINFQNIGNDTAWYIYVLDTLPEEAIINTINIKVASHKMWYTIHDRVIEFHFPDILLPDSSTNEALSQGFVKFSMKLHSGIPAQTQIKNTANIFFDYNAPVTTNTATVILFDQANYIKPLELNSSSVVIYPNPANNTLHLKNVSGSSAYVKIFNNQGATVYTSKYNADDTIDIGFLTPGSYLLEVNCGGTLHREKWIRY